MGFGTFLVALALTTATSASAFKLTIVQSTDIRGRILPSNKYDAECEISASTGAYEGKECGGGVAARTKFIEDVLTSDENVIVLDSGNHFFGSLWYDQFKGQKAVEYINGAVFADDASRQSRPMYSAMNVGSAELYEGTSTLASIGKKLQSPLILTNFNFSSDPSMSTCRQERTRQPCFMDHAVMQVGGRKVGILGFAPTQLRDVSNPGAHLVSKDSVIAAEMSIFAMEKKGVDIIIAMSNADYSLNEELASKVKGIDVILGSSSTLPQLNSATGYIVRQNLISNEPVYITALRRYGIEMLQLELEFDENGLAKISNPQAVRSLRIKYDAEGNATNIDTYAWKKSVQEYKTIEKALQEPSGSTLALLFGERGDPDTSPCSKSVEDGDGENSCPLGSLKLTNGMCCDQQKGNVTCADSCSPVINDRDDSWAFLKPESTGGSVKCCPLRTDTICCNQQSYWDAVSAYRFSFLIIINAHFFSVWGSAFRCANGPRDCECHARVVP